MALWARLRAISLWQAYLAVGALICALYVWVPPFAGSGPVFNLLGLSPLVAIIVGVRRYARESRRARGAGSRSGSCCSGWATSTPTAIRG